MNASGLVCSTTHLERVSRLVALTGNHTNAIDERNYLGWILLLELNFGVEQLQPLYAGLAAVVKHQIFAMPAFLFSIRIQGLCERW